MSKQATIHLSNKINKKIATQLYTFLKNNIEWDEGVKSRKGFTRLAKALSYSSLLRVLEDYPEVVVEIVETIDKYCIRKQCVGVYLNYYQDGNSWTPNHKHNDTSQIIVSLGATRTLKVGNKELKSKNGDIIVFGSSMHGIAKEDVEEGRISIALFMI